MITVAALFVQTNGAYYGLPGVDPWDMARDARTYAGPHPVVAHPPCERWGRYWYGGPSAKVRRAKGDDDGCFASALASVRMWGGVLEHPADSSAWQAFGLPRPPKTGGWVGSPESGWSCHVEQGHYGHRARKATWLYAHGVSTLPQLQWSPSLSRIPRRPHESTRVGAVAWLPKWERAATPPEFRDVLLAIARSVRHGC